MVSWYRSLGDGYEAVAGAWNATLHVDQVPLGIDLHDLQVDDRLADAAHPARQPLALDHARGVGPRSDRARVAPLGMAVRARLAVEAVPLDDALEAAALVRPGDLDAITRGELVDGELLPDLGRLPRVEPELAQHARCLLEPGLLH